MDNWEKEIAWYRTYIEREKDSKSRRVREYISYLERWFDPNSVCDGATYENRMAWKRTPMSYTQYFIG